MLFTITASITFRPYLYFYTQPFIKIGINPNRSIDRSASIHDSIHDSSGAITPLPVFCYLYDELISKPCFCYSCIVYLVTVVVLLWNSTRPVWWTRIIFHVNTLIEKSNNHNITHSNTSFAASLIVGMAEKGMVLMAMSLANENASIPSSRTVVVVVVVDDDTFLQPSLCDGQLFFVAVFVTKHRNLATTAF